jgi:hypothetical protein
MHQSLKFQIAIPWIISTILMSGCDDRATQIAREAADRQAQQNSAMAELNQEVASGAHRLVEADAQARKVVVGVHRDLQAERARLDTSWNDLEQERRHIAGERRTESLVGPAIQTVGMLAVVVIVLGFCWYALVKVQDSGESECAVSELLLDEVLADKPHQRLPGHQWSALIERSQLDDSSAE